VVEFEIETVFEPFDGTEGGPAGSAGASKVVVSRRHSEFEELHEAVCGMFAGLPRVPGPRDEAELGRFIGELCALPGASRNRDVLTFLGVVSLKRLLDESPWLQFTSECQRF
jgi:hypothetical protein